MAFLVLAAASQSPIDPQLLHAAGGGLPITWFAPDDPSRGGIICLSSLTSLGRLKRGDRVDCVIVGRIRLDRAEELRAKLASEDAGDTQGASDAVLCLQAYQLWGAALVDHLHGDFAFAIYDNVTRELLCARDRFGVRMLAWFQSADAYWIAGSMQDLVAAPGFNASALDPIWISDFLRAGLCDDPARSAYSSVRRLAPAHILSLGRQGPSTKRYWTLAVEGPLQLASPAAYAKEFHSRLDAAMRDRLPRDRVGIFLSGGLDSGTLAAKAVHLGGPRLKVVARTWLVDGPSDPEAQASRHVAKYLGIPQTMVDADVVRFDPEWHRRPAATAEPDFAAVNPASFQDDAKAMRAESECWLYGEGPDNALIFEWQMHLGWLVRHRQWARLPGVIASYLIGKPLTDWRTTLRSKLVRSGSEGVEVSPEPAWVRRANTRVPNPPTEWRPKAHAGLSAALWPQMFELQDAAYAPLGIDWRHPYMDLRVLEFMLAVPPIPWARRKRLIRHAMKGQLPTDTLRRVKTPLHRDIFADLLRQHLPTMPRSGDPVEAFVDIDKLPADPASYPDIYALTRVAILQHWLKTRHG